MSLHYLGAPVWSDRAALLSVLLAHAAQSGVKLVATS